MKGEYKAFLGPTLRESTVPFRPCSHQIPYHFTIKYFTMTESLRKSDSAKAVAVERMETQSELGRDTRKIETRVKRKIDFLILPLLSSVYFLAQMVSLHSIGDQTRADTPFRVDPI
jgi:hypothetical protein